MNVFAKFDEIPSKTLQDIKETKRHGHTFVRSDGRVYPPTNTVCGGDKNTVCGGYNYLLGFRPGMTEFWHSLLLRFTRALKCCT